jgi:hypothetical protein
MPWGYTCDQADAHERGYQQGVESARRTLQLLHDRAPDMPTCQVLRQALASIDAIPTPARPSAQPTQQDR